MTEVKHVKELLNRVERMDLNTPDVLLLSGNDPDLLNPFLVRLKKVLKKGVGEFEQTTLSGEPGDADLFLSEAFNIPLFAPYRLFVIHHGQELFKNRTETDFITKLPDRTLIVIQYDGIPSKGFLKPFGERLTHLVSRDIYPEQIVPRIHELAHKKGLSLNDDAVYEIRERIEPREGAIEIALERLKDSLPEERHHKITVEEVEEIIFPNIGMNAIQLVNALFANDRVDAERELANYHRDDNLFGVMKLMLNRADEIRLYAIGKKLAMNDRELLKLLDHAAKPPFVQKRILDRLSTEYRRFKNEKLERVYGMLIALNREFRTQVPPKEQMMIFQIHILDVFFPRS